MLKKVLKIYKKHKYSRNIFNNPGKLSFMHTFHYSRLTKDLQIIILLRFLNYQNPGVMYYH